MCFVANAEFLNWSITWFHAPRASKLVWKHWKPSARVSLISKLSSKKTPRYDYKYYKTLFCYLFDLIIYHYSTNRLSQIYCSAVKSSVICMFVLSTCTLCLMVKKSRPSGYNNCSVRKTHCKIASTSTVISLLEQIFHAANQSKWNAVYIHCSTGLDG